MGRLVRLAIFMTFSLLVVGNGSAAGVEENQLPEDTMNSDQDVRMQDEMELGELESRSFYSDTLNREFRYSVYRPAGYNQDQRYPTLYLLHGRGDTMAGWMESKPVLDRMISDGTIPPLIAVMPDAPSSERAGYYVNSRYDGERAGSPKAEDLERAFFDDLIPQIEATFNVIENRSGRVIAGYSMGGFGATRYVIAHANTFSAAIVLSPAVYTPLPPQDSSAREFGAFGVDAALFDPDRYQELNYPAALEQFSGGRTPIKVFIAVGDDEWKHPNPEDARHDLDMEAHVLFNRLVRVNGVDAELRVYDGGHEWTVWNKGFTEGLIYLSDHLRLGGFISQSGDE